MYCPRNRQVNSKLGLSLLDYMIRQAEKVVTLIMHAALVSRQFVDMTRIRIEGLLAAFPKLVGAGKQHTYVETENVRYVYQPIEVRHAVKARA